MTREIKFRAWGENIKEYMSQSFGGEVEIANVTRILGDLIDQRNWILEQYTGLKDKNGKEIYEGDVLMTCVGRAEVFYDYEYCMWKIFAKHGTTMPLVGKKSRRHLDYEVIGNIHENPELLGGRRKK